MRDIVIALFATILYFSNLYLLYIIICGKKHYDIMNQITVIVAEVD